jgi:hypothetical protein
MRFSGAIYLAVALAGLAGCGSEPAASTSSTTSALTADQCAYFDEGGHTTICHATGSATSPLVLLRVSTKACVNAHADHAGDSIALDGSCGPNACLPEAAPCDSTLPCCEGLACQEGACAVASEEPEDCSGPAGPACYARDASGVCRQICI